ncbi:trimethyllysine dioxygenase [Fusarium longipes]|uniref:trimethyllysine dioxygenase n=1 Tax=Fusarium longipes TaxID=694270 RepID=A0A395T5H7_9HYPO|nr:trimethyllysine dioxygenase [Fusarium longipes]
MRLYIPSDNCQCSACVNQDTRQRNFDTFELHDIKPEHLLNHETHLEVKWNDNHTSIHPWEWLRCWFRGGFQREFAVDDIENDPPKVDYSLGVEQIMADLTKKIWVHGFCLVENAEPTPEATEAFLEKIGPIRNTHYGGFYDFVPDLALADTAYTNIALPAHTDTTYFSEPAGLQAFHCLSHAAPPDQDPEKPLGGESLLVDGFNVAKILRKESPEAYDVLRRTRIPWHASGNKGIAIAPDRTYPVIEADWETNKFHRIRWNNDDRGVVHLFDAKPWYEAASKWNEIVRRETSEFWFKLTPGTIVIFNNWRVMHGRSAFKGTRRICGAYIPRDDFVSRYRETNFEHDKVIGHNLNQSGSHRPRQDRVGYRRPGYYSDRKSDRKSDSKSDSETDPKSDAKNDPKTDPESDPKSDPKLESKPETGSDS